MAAALHPTAFHTEIKPPALAAPGADTGTAGESSPAVVIDVPDSFASPRRGEGRRRSHAAHEAELPSREPAGTRVAVRQTSAGVFAAATAAYAPESGNSADCGRPDAAQTQAAVHAALCAIQAGALPGPPSSRCRTIRIVLPAERTTCALWDAC